MAQEGPGGGAEEGVELDVGGAGAGAESAEFVFDEEFADEGFAEAVEVKKKIVSMESDGWEVEFG